MARPFVCEFRQLVNHNCYLDYLDVFEFGIPMDVCICDDHPRTGSSVFEEGGYCDVVAWHDTVEDVVLAFHVGTVDGRIGEIDQLLVEQDVFGGFVEDGAAVDKFCFAFGHGSCAGLGPEKSFVALDGEFAAEMLVEVILVEFLQTNNICGHGLDRFHN